MKHKIYRTAASTFAVAMLLSGCGKTPASNSNEPVKVSIQTESEGQAVVDGMEQLTPDGPDYERLRIFLFRRQSLHRSICGWVWNMRRSQSCRPG